MNVIFKPFTCPAEDGTMILLSLAREDQNAFLQSILSAPKLTPISFEAAMAICWDKSYEMCDDGNFKEANQFLYKSCLVSYLNLQGFSIVLRGDEYSINENQLAA